MDIAIRFYGLYMVGFAVTDAERIDVNCGMDNAGVPIFEHQLTDDQRKFIGL